MRLHSVSRAAGFLALVLAVTGCPDKDGGKSSCPAPVGTEFDTDGDLLTNVQELARGTNPDEPDTDGDGFGDYVEAMAGTDPLALADAPAGQVASVRQITSESELIGGPGAQGRVGDWLLENDRIRAIVQSPDAEQMQVGKFGGNLIDADVIRAGPGIDRVGSIFPFFSVSATSAPNRVVIVNDGSDGGAAILRTCGKEAPFEYLDLEATVRTFGLVLNYESNKNYDVAMSNDFVLAPGSNVVEIITTVRNDGKSFRGPVGSILDSGASQEVFLSNYQGFGKLDFSALLDSEVPPTRYLGFIAPDAAWGFVGDPTPNVALNIYGITAIVSGYTTPLEIIQSDPANGPAQGMMEFTKGKRASWRRGIVVTDGAGATEPISAEYVRRYEAGQLHAGTVGDTLPVVGARVVALERGGPLDERVLSVTESDANGDYSFFLPDGDYYIASDMPGREWPIFSGATAGILTRVFETTIPVGVVTLSGTNALPDITFQPASTLTVTVTEAGTLGAPVPSKLTVVGTDPSPGDSIFRSEEDRLPSSVNAVRHSADGQFTLVVEPGNYDVYASRGLEWSLDSDPVTVVLGATTSTTLAIGRVVNTPGWMSGDFHVHLFNSPDSPVTKVERVLSGVAEGLDVIVTTDHDFVTDLTPEISALGLTDDVACSIGNEISSTALGHFIAYPLTIDPDSTTGGAFFWSGPKGAINAPTYEEIVTGIDEANPGSQVAIVAHPRGQGLTDYYNATQLDTITLFTERPAEEMRIPTRDGATEQDTRMFFDGFDGQEVMNGATDTGTNRNMLLNDFFTMLSHGLTLAAVGSSDTHSRFNNQVGIPRTYVEMANDTPSTFAANQEAFAVAMKEGRAFLTSGPFVEVVATGDDAGGPGDLVLPRNSDDAVTVSVRLEMPDWVSVDTLRIYVNTPATGAPAGESISTPPAPQYTFPILVTSTNAGNGLVKNVFEDTYEVPVPTTGDAWIVVEVEGTTGATLFPVVPQGPRPYALVSAIYADGNRNGAWDAPGNVTAGPFESTAAPKIFTPDEVEANLTEIRQQFLELQRRGGHKH